VVITMSYQRLHELYRPFSRFVSLCLYIAQLSEPGVRLIQGLASSPDEIAFDAPPGRVSIAVMPLNPTQAGKRDRLRGGHYVQGSLFGIADGKPSGAKCEWSGKCEQSSANFGCGSKILIPESAEALLGTILFEKATGAAFGLGNAAPFSGT
jgi:hypothetical protein